MMSLSKNDPMRFNYYCKRTLIYYRKENLQVPALPHVQHARLDPPTQMAILRRRARAALRAHSPRSARPSAHHVLRALPIQTRTPPLHAKRATRDTSLPRVPQAVPHARLDLSITTRTRQLPATKQIMLALRVRLLPKGLRSVLLVQLELPTTTRKHLQRA